MRDKFVFSSQESPKAPKKNQPLLYLQHTPPLGQLIGGEKLKSH